MGYAIISTYVGIILSKMCTMNAYINVVKAYAHVGDDLGH